MEWHQGTLDGLLPLRSPVPPMQGPPLWCVPSDGRLEPSELELILGTRPSVDELHGYQG